MPEEIRSKQTEYADPGRKKTEMNNRRKQPERQIRNHIIRKIRRSAGLGLATAILFAQTALADVYITPLGNTVESSQTAAESTEQEAAAEPGAAAAQTPVPSASYSTKELVVQKPATEPGMTEGPGAAEKVGNQTEVAAQPEQTAAAEIAAPQIQAEAAILYDATHEKFLYEKKADEKLYPASITKLMTALLVLEHADLSETVTFSQTAVTNLESGAVTLNLAAGDQVSVKDCLYGLLLRSANEAANGLAEHVSGSISGFADMMNAKAASLGCTGTNFVNPNGLNNQNHYTTCRDMAKIAEAAFSNQTICEIASTLSYTFPATKNASARTITPGHKMLYPTDFRYYEGIVGGKTGYTSLAGNTLVTCTEKDGVRMIAVVLKARGTHYTDTKAMLDYGYELVKAGAVTESQTSGNCHKWIADGADWRFELADGTRLKSCLVLIDEVEYAFDAEGKMVTGWLSMNGQWYYFNGSGAMVKNEWRQDQGKWFYLGDDGTMARDTWVDRQYYVGADGIWIP